MTDRSALFESYVRTDTSPSRFLEGSYAFLDRAAGPYWQQVRDVMADWLAHVPQRHRSDLRQRLANPVDQQFNGAYLELYLHEVFLRLGCNVEVHPEVAGPRHPDFLVDDGSQRFYLEARQILNQSDQHRARRNRQSAMYDSLQGVNSPNFFLRIDIREIGARDLPKRPLIHDVEAWLCRLDPDIEQARLDSAGSLLALQEFAWRQEGWDVRLRAIPKSARARGKPGVRPLGMFGDIKVEEVDGVTPIRRALDEKAGAYGQLDFPFIIALGVDWFTGRDQFDITGALFGRSQLEIEIIDDQPGSRRLTRAPDGFWFGGNRWLHQHVTGVLQVTSLHPARFAHANPTLWLHPSPTHRVAPLAAWRVMLPSEGEIHEEPARITCESLFGLPDPWPAGDPFPQEN